MWNNFKKHDRTKILWPQIVIKVKSYQYIFISKKKIVYIWL